MPEAKPYAVFDVDGTIFKSSLLEKVIDSSIQGGLMPAAPFNDAYRIRRNWQRFNNEGTYRAYIDSLVGAFAAQVAGISVERFQIVSQEMLETQKDRMLAFPRKLIRELKASHYFIALSGSPQILVEPFLEELGFDEVKGTDYEFKGGKFTGKFEPIPDKGKYLENLVERGVVSKLGSVAVGDTSGDISMLRHTDHPVMFNAAKVLVDYGEQFGWPQVGEVKDRVTVLTSDEENVYRKVDLGDFLASLRS